MSNDLSSLSEDHVRQLGRIIETLEKSTFDYLQLEVGELKVTIGKGNAVIADAAMRQPAVVPAGAPVASPAAQAVPAAAPALAPAPAAASSGLLEITAPIVGMFYAQPEPGAAPFVTLGATVQPDTTVGLIEVMKTFNAVGASVSGKIVEICVTDTQLVEYGQVLFRVAAE